MREREREGERGRESEGESERQTDRQRHREGKRKREREIEKGQKTYMDAGKGDPGGYNALIHNLTHFFFVFILFFL